MQLFIIIILCFFALYGAIQMFMGMLKSYRRSNLEKTLFWHTLVCVKDNEEILEGLLRSYAYDEFENLVILDAGSTDDSMVIAKRFANDNAFVHIMQPEEYIDFLLTHLSVKREKI